MESQAGHSPQEGVDMSTAVVPYADMERMATSIVKSGLFGIQNTDQAMALMTIAVAEGKHPAIIARDFNIIQGRPAKKAEAMMRDFCAAGGSVKWHALDDALADATFSHPQGGSVRITWDLERAKQAGLAGKDNWKKYTRAMLRSRCVSEGIRTVAPLATSGVYTPEEVQDMTVEPVTVEHAESPAALADDELAEHLQAIEQAVDLDELKRVYGTAYHKAKAVGSLSQLMALEAAKDSRKGALLGEAA